MLSTTSLSFAYTYGIDKHHKRFTPFEQCQSLFSPYTFSLKNMALEKKQENSNVIQFSYTAFRQGRALRNENLGNSCRSTCSTRTSERNFGMDAIVTVYFFNPTPPQSRKLKR